MASQADLFSRLSAYIQAQNPQLQVVRGGNLWGLVTAFTMAAADTQAKSEAAAAQAQLGSATGDYLTALAADRGIIRKAAVVATASGVFSRAVADPNVAVTIPANSVVQTTPAPGGAPQQYLTLASATIPMGGTASNTVTVQAATPGIAANVGIGQINVIAQAPAGISFSNSSAATGGATAESDAALRLRVLQGIAPANSPASIAAAALGVPGIFAAVVVDPMDGAGNYTVYASDVNGALSGGLTSAVTTAIAAVDGIGLTRHVVAITTLTQAVAASIAVDAAYTYSAVATQVQNALASYMLTLTPGQVFHPSDLTKVVFGAIIGYTAIPGLVAFYPTTPAAAIVPTATQMVRLSGTATLTQVTN